MQVYLSSDLNKIILTMSLTYLQIAPQCQLLFPNMSH